MKNIGLIIICCAVLIGVLWQIYERRSRRSKIKDRPTLSDDEIYTLFYSDSKFQKAIIIDFWHKLARVLHVDPGKIRPSDSINELKCSRLTIEDDTDAIASLICKEIPLKENVPDVLDLRLIDDTVRYVAEGKQKSQTSNS